MNHVLVIGGTAFIGRALVDRLLERGADVTILHRGIGTPWGDRVKELRCDRNEVDAVRNVLAGHTFDTVFDNVYDWQRGTGAEPVVAAAEALADGLNRYVFTSSIAAYGGGMDHSETDALAPADHPDRYMREKASTERALFAMHASSGVPVTTLRPAFVYGRHNPFDREAFFWDRILDDRPIIIPGDGERPMQFVLVDDVARAAILAATVDDATGSAFNLALPPITQVELVHALARAAGRTAQVVHVSRERIEAAGGSVFEPPFYFGVYLDLPPLTVRTGRARDVLGLDQTPFDEGLRETFAWYRQQKRATPDYGWEDGLLADPG